MSTCSMLTDDRRRRLMCFALLATLASLLHSCSASWGTPDSSQYHIQTDEGPERFFRYQTDNGQYRKERRLEDGTVIGTEAWIDAFGYVRLKDYIADSKGYRILKSKTLFVGQDTPVKEAVKLARKSPAPANSLLSPLRPINVIDPIDHKSNQHDHHNEDHHHHQSQPIHNDYLTPSNQLLPSRPAPIAAYSPPPSSSHSDTLRRTPIDGRTHPQPQPVQPLIKAPANGLQAPLFSAFGGVEQHSAYNSPAKSGYNPEPVGKASIRPIFDRSSFRRRTEAERQRAPLVSDNTIGDGYTPQYPPYDGVSRTEQSGDGFEYYLPRHYHREASSEDGRRKAGDFGYVDPFGIRRVVYYAAGGPEEGGFRVRQNNRYVGFGATPYDPRPLREEGERN